MVANWGAAEISAVIATSAHAVAAAHAAAVGDWQAVPDHAIDMANAAGNFLSGGLLGAVESAVDAAAAVSREMGHEAPTFSELQHEGIHDLGDAIADGIYFALHPDAIPGAGAGPANHAVNGDGHDASSTDGGAHDASGASGVTQDTSIDASHDASSLDGGSSWSPPATTPPASTGGFQLRPQPRRLQPRRELQLRPQPGTTPPASTGAPASTPATTPPASTAAPASTPATTPPASTAAPASTAPVRTEPEEDTTPSEPTEGEVGGQQIAPLAWQTATTITGEAWLWDCAIELP